MGLVAVVILTPVSHNGGALDSMRWVHSVSKDCKIRAISKHEKQATLMKVLKNQHTSGVRVFNCCTERDQKYEYLQLAVSRICNLFSMCP